MALRSLPWLTLVLLLMAACALITPTPPPPTDVPTPNPTSPPTPTVPPLPTATPTPAPAHLMLWENLPPAQASALIADVEAFEAAYPHTTIEVQHYDDAQTLIEAIVGGTADYHLMLGDASLAAALQAQESLEPLDALFPARS